MPRGCADKNNHTNLPDTDNSVGDKNEQNNKRFNKGGDRVVIFKES